MAEQHQFSSLEVKELCADDKGALCVLVFIEFRITAAIRRQILQLRYNESHCRVFAILGFQFRQCGVVAEITVINIIAHLQLETWGKPLTEIYEQVVLIRLSQGVLRRLMLLQELFVLLR